jgi:hypothetical protein
MMSLQDWLNEGHLKTHKTSKAEITQLLAVCERDLADAQVKDLSADRRLATAYNAALVLCVAALAASGFQASNVGHHYWTIQSLDFTLKTDARTIDKFNKIRQKRNISDYERIGMASEKDVTEMLNLANNLRVSLEAWLRIYHPDLI